MSSPLAPDAGLDRLSALLQRFRVRAHLFHSGPLCGVSSFDARPGRAFMHVLRRGEMVVTHASARRGLRKRLHLREPSLLLYPRPLAHDFHNAPREGSDFTCATLDFDGGDRHPLVAALPPLLVVPLAQVPGLQSSLALLFAETDHVRCGSRLLADRLFEVVLIQLLRWLIDHGGEVGLGAGLLAGLAEPRLAKALVAVHEQPGAPWTLERMAQQAGQSRSAFASAFRLATGQTPAAYLADWRLALAEAGLREGQSLKALAADLGYGSGASLAKAFKQAHGRSPRDWLRGQPCSAAHAGP
jgi:AraC-like DNA-binding protein